MASRKRTASQRAKTLELDRNEKGKEETPKLVLKTSSTQRQGDSGLLSLERCLDLQEDEVIDHLLLASQLLLYRLHQDWEEGFELIKLLWQKYNTNAVISGVLVNMLMQMAPQAPSLSIHHHTFMLSMFENG